jgi:hypothetical protein
MAAAHDGTGAVIREAGEWAYPRVPPTVNDADSDIQKTGHSQDSEKCQIIRWPLKASNDSP